MIRLDHLAIPVRDRARSREWYTTNFGFKIEFELPERRTVALQDDGDLTLFLIERSGDDVVPSCTLTLQVDDVDAKYRELSERGVVFENAPQKLFWGYGAELRDPDGYLINLWDQKSMRERWRVTCPGRAGGGPDVARQARLPVLDHARDPDAAAGAAVLGREPASRQP